MPYDVVAYEADELTHALTEGEEGIFHRMLRKAWMNGSIPADLNSLANLCRVRPSTMRKAWPKISKLWTCSEENPERLRNKKQESERIFLESKRELARSAGKASAKSREIKDSEPTDVEPTLNGRSTSQPSPSQPNPTIKEGERKPVVPSALRQLPKYSAEFEGFWQASTKRGSKVEAWGQWQRIGITRDLIGLLLDGMSNWRRSEQWQDETKQPHIVRWLRRRGWEEIVPKSNRGESRETRAEEIVRKNHEAGQAVRDAIRRADGDSDGDSDHEGANGFLREGSFGLDE